MMQKKEHESLGMQHAAFFDLITQSLAEDIVGSKRNCETKGGFAHNRTLKKYPKTVLQYRFKTLHKDKTQKRSTASDSIIQLIPDSTECTSPISFS